MSDKQVELEIYIPDDQSFLQYVSIIVSGVAPNHYQVMEVHGLIEAISYLDIIELEPQTDGTMLFKRIITPANFRKFVFIIPESFIDTDGLQRILDRVIEVGGGCARMLGGMLTICIPPTSDYDPTADLNNLAS